jgi:hypothetical protein
MCTRCYSRWLSHTPKDERGTAPRFTVKFWDKVIKTHEHGCWLWTEPRDKQGYGRWGKTPAHRYSWQQANGPIPDGLWILHHCDNPPCVNPAHLYPGTVVENTRDAVTRGRTYRPPRKSHCAKGHAKEGDNRAVVTDKGRPRDRCRQCENERSAARQREARAERGLQKTKLSNEEKTRIWKLSQNGMSQRKIAVEVGRSLMAVQSVLKEAER